MRPLMILIVPLLAAGLRRTRVARLHSLRRRRQTRDQNHSGRIAHDAAGTARGSLPVARPPRKERNADLRTCSGAKRRQVRTRPCGDEGGLRSVAGRSLATAVR